MYLISNRASNGASYLINKCQNKYQFNFLPPERWRIVERSENGKVGSRENLDTTKAQICLNLLLCTFDVTYFIVEGE